MINLLSKSKNKFIVIDYGKTSVTVSFLKAKGDNFQLDDWKLFSIKELGNDQGFDKEIIAESIKKFLKKNFVSTEDVVIALSDHNTIFIRYLVMQKLEDEEILQAAMWDLKEEVHFDIEKATIDWKKTDEFLNEEGEKQMGILFVAVDKATIDSCLDLVSKCKLNLKAITCNSFNYGNILEHLSDTLPISSVLDVDSNDLTLSIYSQNKLSFVRTLPITWDMLLKSVTETLISGQGQVKLSEQDAQEIFTNVGISSDDTQAFKGGIKPTKILTLIGPFLEALVREIKFSFYYYASHYNQDNPSVLYITGKDANLKNLDNYLTKELGIEVKNLNFAKKVEVKAGDELTQDDQNKLANSIGSAFYDQKTINLLPLKLKAKIQERVQNVVLKMVSFTLIAIFLLLLYMASIEIKGYDSRIAARKVHLQVLDRVNELNNKINEWYSLINKTREGKLPSEGLLKLISQLTPNEMILNELVLKQDTHVLFLRGTISKKFTQKDAELTYFMQKLEESDIFREVSMISVSDTSDTKQFEIKCDLVR